jgi:hypothetical protein
LIFKNKDKDPANIIDSNILFQLKFDLVKLFLSSEEKMLYKNCIACIHNIMSKFYNICFNNTKNIFHFWKALILVCD